MNQHDKYTAAKVGSIPKGEHQGQRPAGSPRPQMRYQYHQASDMSVPGDTILDRPLNAARGGARELVRASLITGSLAPGFQAPGNDQPEGYFPGGSASSSRNMSRGGGVESPTRIRGELQSGSFGELESGPNVRAVAPQREIMPSGNDSATRAHRALGPGPSPQFGPVSSELAEVSQMMGGKTVASRDTPPWLTEGNTQQPAQRRAAGGRIKGILDGRS